MIVGGGQIIVGSVRVNRSRQPLGLVEIADRESTRDTPQHDGQSGLLVAYSADPPFDVLDVVAKHRLVREPDGTTVLYVGAENWPFPIPLASKAGAWYFDAATGKAEVLFRRIGENEATAIETCHALVLTRQPQETTATDDGDPVIQYAHTLVRANAGGDASASGKEPSGPFHGYYFRMLTGQSKGGAAGKAGFAFIAYPAEYRSSGVMTFAVTQDGTVYKRDLGPDSSKLAEKMTAGSRSSGWHTAE